MKRLFMSLGLVVVIALCWHRVAYSQGQMALVENFGKQVQMPMGELLTGILRQIRYFSHNIGKQESLQQKLDTTFILFSGRARYSCHESKEEIHFGPSTRHNRFLSRQLNKVYDWQGHSPLEIESELTFRHHKSIWWQWVKSSNPKSIEAISHLLHQGEVVDCAMAGFADLKRIYMILIVVAGIFLFFGLLWLKYESSMNSFMRLMSFMGIIGAAGFSLFSMSYLVYFQEVQLVLINFFKFYS